MKSPNEKSRKLAINLSATFTGRFYGSLEPEVTKAANEIDAYVAKALAAHQKKAEKLINALKALKVIHWPLFGGMKSNRTIKIIEAAIKTYRKTRTPAHGQT